MKKRFVAIVLTIVTVLCLFMVPVSAATKATPKPVVTRGLGTIGKISIAGTKVSYPIVVAKDNAWYLDKGATGKKDVNGAIFMDYRNRDLTRRRNVILYGHNMKSGKMFATLHYFAKKTNFDKYTKIYVELFNRKYEYEIVLVAQFNTKQFNHTRTQFKSNDEIKKYLESAVARAKYIRSGFIPTGSEEILTLSTCVSRSIRNYKDYKWVVMAKRVKDNGIVSGLVIK